MLLHPCLLILSGAVSSWLTAARLAVLERLSVMVLATPIPLRERAERTANRHGTQTHTAVVVGLVTIVVVNGQFVVSDQNVMGEKTARSLKDFCLILVPASVQMTDQGKQSWFSLRFVCPLREGDSRARLSCLIGTRPASCTDCTEGNWLSAGSLAEAVSQHLGSGTGHSGRIKTASCSSMTHYFPHCTPYKAQWRSEIVS